MSETDIESVDIKELYETLMLVLAVKGLPDSKVSTKNGTFIRVYRAEEDRDEKIQNLLKKE